MEKKVSDEIDAEILTALQDNYNALFKEKTLRMKKDVPCNVQCLLGKINKDSERISRRALHQKLKKFYDNGVALKKLGGREVFYYYNRYASAFFWKETLRPFIEQMRKAKGVSSWGLTLIPSKTHFLALRHKAAIIEDGIDITSKMRWEEFPRDIVGEIEAAIVKIVARELRARLGIHLNHDEPSFKRSVEKLQRHFAGKRLAIVYVLDGSESQVLDRKEMGDAADSQLVTPPAPSPKLQSPNKTNAESIG